jgi:hypothetical protein
MMNIGTAESKTKPWERLSNMVYPTKPEIVGCVNRNAGTVGLTIKLK